MAVARTATIVDAAPIGASGRHLTLSVESLGFVGGQYIIIDSGKTLPSGKAAKRAYSIASRDDVQDRIELIVKRIVDDAGGFASSFLHDAPVGTSFPFSGPWGKYLPAADGVDRAEREARTLVLATDTGITAALGLLAGRAWDGRAITTDVVWLADDSFVPEPFVAERLGGRCASLRVLRPHGDRIAATVDAALTLAGARGFGAVYLSGDGDVLTPVRSALVQCGVDDGAIRSEPFFHIPKAERKAT
jgi:ferredoxin-NADP reductase